MSSPQSPTLFPFLQLQVHSKYPPPPPPPQEICSSAVSNF